MKYIQTNQQNEFVRYLSNAVQHWDDNNYCTPEALVKDGKAEQFGVVPLVEVAAPAYDPITQSVEQSAPLFVGDQWVQQWIVIPIPPEKVEENYKASVPTFVTMRQARLALLGAGLLSNIDLVINSLPSPQKEAAKIEWEYSQEVQRHNGFVSVLAPMLDMTDKQIDELFIQAAKL